MAYTVNNIVNAAITELSQVPGLVTQVYSTPRLTQMVSNAVELETDEMWWPQLRYRQLGVTVADTGLLSVDLTGPISSIDQWTDVEAVFNAGSNRRIPELPQSVNPGSITSGGRYRYIEPISGTAHRPFRLWPAIAGTVDILARQRVPTPMAGVDTVYIDNLLILYDVCWMYAVDDGTIPAQVNKYQVLAANRRKKLMSLTAQQPLRLDTRYDWSNMIDAGVGDGDDFFVLDQDPLA